MSSVFSPSVGAGRMARSARLVLAFGGLALLGACVDATAPADVTVDSRLRLSLHEPAGISEAEVSALAAAFDRVDAYRVTIVDSGTSDVLTDTTLVIQPDPVQHVLDVAVPEVALGRTVGITVVGLDGGMELYRSALETTLGESGTMSLNLEIRYTGPGIHGQVTGPDGSGLGGVTMNLVQDQSIVDAVATEADGTYLFLDVPTGSYHLVPAPPQGQAACPALWDVTLQSSTDAVSADFEVVDGSCGTSVLVLSGGDFDDTDSVRVILEGDPDLSVSTFFFVNDLPSADFLAQFDAVLLFMNGLFDESSALGARVAGYVSSGGNVVLGSFYWQGRSDSGKGSAGWGDLESIDPFTSVGGATYQAASLGAVTQHPLTTNLASLESSAGYRGGALAKDGTSVVAWWDDDAPLIGYRLLGAGQRVVGVTLFPGCCAIGDVGALWQNAVNWAASREDLQQVEPLVWTDLVVGDPQQRTSATRPVVRSDRRIPAGR